MARGESGEGVAMRVPRAEQSHAGRDAPLLFPAVVENKTLERSCVTIYRPAAYPFYFRAGRRNIYTRV